jgi:aminoglycoside phosphotransferase (APT) family kinase protein
VRDALSDSARVGALGQRDRELLLNVLGELSIEISHHQRAPHSVLHGSPHSFNVLAVDGQPLRIDFEMTCIGPIEWDLAHTAPEIADAYSEPINGELLQLCRGLVSVKTATWCWANIEHPELRWHAEHHLAVVRHLHS